MAEAGYLRCCCVMCRFCVTRWGAGSLQCDLPAAEVQALKECHARQQQLQAARAAAK